MQSGFEVQQILRFSRIELDEGGTYSLIRKKQERRRIRRRDIMKNLLTNNLIASAPLAVAAIAMVASVVA